MNLPTMAAAQAVAMRPEAAQTFVVTVRLLEPKREFFKAEPAKSESKPYPEDTMSERQRNLIIQLISQNFWDAKDREREFAKIDGFSRTDADAYIRSLLKK